MIETKSAHISKLDENTIKVVFKPNALLEKEEYDTLYGHYQSILGKDSEMKFLVIIQQGFKMKEKYVNFFKKNYRTDFKKAEAFIVLNPASRMFFKVGLAIVKNNYPARLFDTEQEALNWLNTIK